MAEGDKIIKKAIDTYGRVDILINNAGTSVLGVFYKTNEEGWKVTMDTHVYGAYKCSRAAWNVMR